MTTTVSPNHPTCHQCQGQRFYSMPSIHKDNNSMLLLRSELGQLRDQLNKKNKQLEQQQLDMEQLNNKYVAALDQVSTIQHEKDLAERELEDLTSRLFEQANMMVANEKREVYRLRTELDRKQHQLESQQTKYKQLLHDHQQEISVSSSTSTSSTSTAVSATSNSSSSSIKHGLGSSFHHSDTKMPTTLLSSLSYQRASSFCTTNTLGGDDSMIMDWVYDQQYIQLFRQFIKSLGTSNKPSLSQHKQHPFMKQCLLGDVEPCLNFGSNNKLYSIKKMIDSMMQQPCLLEEIQSTPTITSTTTTTTTTGSMESDTSFLPPTPSTPTSGTSTSLIGNTVSSTASSIGLRWSRFVSQGASLVDCAGCGNTLDMQHYYRFRLNDGGDSDWLHLDTPCRDRLKAVCTFFRFMRQQIHHTSPVTTTTTTTTIPIITTTQPTNKNEYTNDDNQQQQEDMGEQEDVLGLGSTKQQQDHHHLTLYMEMTQLRLAMFYARLGIKRSSCCWTDDDSTSITSTQSPMTPVSSISRRMSSSKVQDEK